MSMSPLSVSVAAVSSGSESGEEAEENQKCLSAKGGLGSPDGGRVEGGAVEIRLLCVRVTAQNSRKGGYF
jgi:hypothetical protein